MVSFNPDDNIDTVLDRASHERTTLTAYFEANANNGRLGEKARKYTYQEFPQHFTWKSIEKKWSIRQSNPAIGRMYFVPPTAGERFYLRTLLTVVKGAKSFDDLQRYQSDDLLPTFHTACIARGLLENDGEWTQCLSEACQMQTGSHLRHLFTTILLFCAPTHPNQLWEDFRQQICDDLPYRLRTLGVNNISTNNIYDYGLYIIDNILQESGHLLSDWPCMPGGLYPAPQIPAGIRWNYRIPADSGRIIFWQRALPNLPFRGQHIPAE